SHTHVWEPAGGPSEVVPGSPGTRSAIVRAITHVHALKTQPTCRMVALLTRDCAASSCTSQPRCLLHPPPSLCLCCSPRPVHRTQPPHRRKPPAHATRPTAPHRVFPCPVALASTAVDPQHTNRLSPEDWPCALSASDFTVRRGQMRHARRGAAHD